MALSPLLSAGKPLSTADSKTADLLDYFGNITEKYLHQASLGDEALAALGALQYVDKRMCIVSVDRARPPGACPTVITRTSLPGSSVRSLDMSAATFGS